MRHKTGWAGLAGLGWLAGLAGWAAWAGLLGWLGWAGLGRDSAWDWFCRLLARISSNRASWVWFSRFLEPTPESVQIELPGIRFIGFWSQGLKVFKSSFLGLVFLTSGANARKSSNQASWDSFCRLLAPRPESHQIESPGTGFFDYWSQRQKSQAKASGAGLAGLGWLAGWAGWLGCLGGGWGASLKYKAKVPKRKISRETLQTQVPKRTIPSVIFQTTNPKRTIPSESSFTKGSKQEVLSASRSFQSKDPKR